MTRLIVAMCMLIATACTSTNVKTEVDVQVPETTFGLSMDIPDDNPMSEAKIALGRSLFFDPNLSLDSTISCASCHKPSYAFADTMAFSQGVEGRIAKRNTPTIVNAGYFPHYMAEGGVKSLELQAIAPIENPDEMGIPIVELAARLNKSSNYVSRFKEVWGDSVSPFFIMRSLAAFERTIVGGTSPFDEFEAGDSNALSGAALRGFNLFRSERFGCTNCHSGPLFTDHTIQNNGLYEDYFDNGKYRLSLDEKDKGKFKVPTLRNIALTAPYMHDGEFLTLEEVLQHYSGGGSNHVNRSAFIRKIDMSEEDMSDVIEFLKSLTDSTDLNYSIR